MFPDCSQIWKLFPEIARKLLRMFGGPDRDRTDDLFHAMESITT